MSTNWKKILSAFIVIVLVASTFIGCGGKKEEPAPVTPDSSAASETPAEDKEEDKTEETPDVDPRLAGATPEGYPLQTDTKLTWWMDMKSNYASYANNFGEIDFAKNFEEIVGVEIEYIQPPMGQESEQYNIMIASGDLTDIIEWRWVTQYPGGSMAAMDDAVILDLTDVIAEHAPYYSKYLDDRPDFLRQVKTDDGRLFCFPFVRGADVLKTTSGPILRADWLEELGMEAPETIEEWEAVLTAFKDEKGATAPYTGQASNDDPNNLYNVFLTAYGLRTGIFIDDGVVKYGSIEPGFKDFLTQMNDWYNKGLIDQNFLSADRKHMDANILNGVSGACYGPGGGGLGPWIDAAKEADADTTFDLVATKFPVINKGDTPHHAGTSYDFTQASPGMAAITTKCEDVEIAAKVLDYAFSDEGHMLYNFGIEGETYEMVDGIPTYTDMITDNPDGLNFAQALSKYSRANTNGPFEQHEQYLIQYYAKPQQQNALVQWSDQDSLGTLEPPVSLTTEESNEEANLLADIDTYRKEMVAKFLTNAESLDNFDAYVEQMEKLGIDRVVEIHQAAYDRYLAR